MSNYKTQIPVTFAGVTRHYDEEKMKKLMVLYYPVATLTTTKSLHELISGTEPVMTGKKFVIIGIHLYGTAAGTWDLNRGGTIDTAGTTVVGGRYTLGHNEYFIPDTDSANYFLHITTAFTTLEYLIVFAFKEDT